MSFVPVFPTQGSYPLTSIAGLPNVTVAFPGEHWTNAIASGNLLPGQAVVPTHTSDGKLAYKPAAVGDLGDPRMCIVKQPVSIPDQNVGSIYNPALGPNEIVNLPIKNGSYVHVYRTGAFHLTLCVPKTYNPGDMLAWNATGARPDGKPGGANGAIPAGISVGDQSLAGAWDIAGSASVAFFEVVEFRPYIASDSLSQPEGIVTVKTLRAQF